MFTSVALASMRPITGQSVVINEIMYRGIEDPRFILLPYDLDTILGLGNQPGLVANGIFRAAAIPALHRLLTSPKFASRYYYHLNELMENSLSVERLGNLLDQALGPYVPAPAIDSIKAFSLARNEFVKSLIPLELTVANTLPHVNGYPRTITGELSLNGTANVIETRSVRVNGQDAIWSAWEGTWQAGNVALRPGINRIIIQAFNAMEREIDRTSTDVWFDTGKVTSIASPVIADMTLTAAAGPFFVSNVITVPRQTTLRIESSSTVFIGPNAGLLIEGRLLVEGNEFDRVRLTRLPEQTVGWNGIRFNNSLEANRLKFCDIEFSNAGAQTIRLDHSLVLIDHTTWSGTTRTIIEMIQSSMTIRNSVFPDLLNSETIHGVGMPDEGHVIIENNLFGSTTGYSDIIDFSGGKRPGPIIQILNNVFRGGSDDGLDLDGTDAHIEGNVFSHFHKNNDGSSTSSAIATDVGSEITVVRNVFFDNDHAILLKGGASLSAHNNTIVGSTIAAINFGEHERGVLFGRRAHLDGDLLWNNAQSFKNFTPAESGIDLKVKRSILPESTAWPRSGNLIMDPRFIREIQDFRLRPGSPAVGVRPNGLDMGAFVPPGISISGERDSITSANTATLHVGGPGMTHYRFRVNESRYSDERSVGDPIQLSQLSDGGYQVFAIGKNSAGVWQDESERSASRPWTVDRAIPRIRLNEILARNETALMIGMSTPDWIELHNPGIEPVDLSEMNLSDDFADLKKFKFPSDISLQGGDYLLLFADDRLDLPGIHLGFALNGEGESVFLSETTDRGTVVVDSVFFGLQIPDVSIGRLADGSWGLTQPTGRSRNIAKRLGDVRALRINEWMAGPSSD